MSMPSSSTRQQLDELDALLQKMLNLPLSTAEETPSAPPPPPPRRPIAPPPAPEAISPPLDMPSTARYSPAPAEPLPPPAPPRAPVAPPATPMTFSGRPAVSPPPPQPVAESLLPPPPPPPPPAPSTTPADTVFDSSWKVEIPGTPLPPPSVFRGWTTETDPLAGPPRRPKPAPGRFTMLANEESLPSESQIIDFRSPLSEPAAQPAPEPQPEPMRYAPPQPAYQPEAYSAPLPPPVAPVAMPTMSPPVMPQPSINPAPSAIEPMVEASTPLLALPLVWFNASADFFLRRFGPVGRFLTTNTGRNLLGWTGILLCAAAVGLGVKDYLRIGWTP